MSVSSSFCHYGVGVAKVSLAMRSGISSVGLERSLQERRNQRITFLVMSRVKVLGSGLWKKTNCSVNLSATRYDVP